MGRGTKTRKKHDVIPFFQPIVSIRTQQIFGYETLGRGVTEGRMYSLGPFFKDPSVSDERHIEVDRQLRAKAMRALVQSGSESKLFINIKPAWIFKAWQETGILQTLELAKQAGFDPSRLVIEITEEEFHGRLYELTEIVEVYRQAGCTIAVDDVGSGFSNFDRIAVLQPKILKVDLNILKKSASHQGYRALLKSFSILASQMGSALLVEGVERPDDLQNALHAGARYVQGYMVGRAAPALLDEGAFTEQLKVEIDRFSAMQFEKFDRMFEFEQRLNKRFVRHAALLSADEADEWIQLILPDLPDYCLRAYICCGNGEQVSSNFSNTKAGGWLRDGSFRGSNWLWRPYFIPNVVMMSREAKGILSAEYTDLETSKPIQTYSCPIGDNCYLFLDMHAQ
ncbi:EAL domain-containing protein [Paenibacillus turpanensis]|uniref:EAL domain-containing protein n=1 Tax=Paenibacillus turpanensis TaxID=2689078 RepID=UPI00140D54DE|nr:EAL domain-containing protein [Paenibacillus turpanensis]